MKRFWMMLCTVLLCAAVTGCGRGNEDTQSGTEGSSAVEESAGEDAGQSQETEQPQEEVQGEESLPEEEGIEGGVEGDQAAGWSPQMEAIKQAVVDTFGENYWPTTAILPEVLEGNYGITPDMYVDYMGEVPMMMTNVDTLIVIKPAEGQEQAVEDALNAYRDMLVSDTMQYPMNLGKIQASRIERVGDYVCFVQLGADVIDVLEQGDEAVIAHCLEQNELAIEVIRLAVVK